MQDPSSSRALHNIGWGLLSVSQPSFSLCPVYFLLSPASVHLEHSDQSASWTQVSEAETDFWGVHPVTVFHLPSQLCKHAVLTQMKGWYKHERWLTVVIVGIDMCTGLGEVVSQIKIHSFVFRIRVHRRKGDSNDQGKQKEMVVKWAIWRNFGRIDCPKLDSRY